MARRRTLLRVLRIQRVLVKYGLDDVIAATHLLRPLRFLFYIFPRRRNSSAPLGERIRLALEELGPIFVKFGQAISTRRDLLPRDIADELAKLQDAVPPFPADQAVKIIEDAYGESVDTVFERFDREPFAAASIAQVHTAKIASGAEVIVKILRPGVEEQIEQDLDVLRWLAGLAAKYWQHGKRLRPLEVVAEYERTVIDELDLMREAANTAQLKRNFQGSDLLIVPDIYWDFCRPEVLVQERIYGTPISDMEALRAAGTNIKVLAENGVEIFFTQVTAPHHLAAQAGLDVLRAGGNAVEAMVAAASTIAVVYPHMNAIGGDGFWLIHAPGADPVAVDACGGAGQAVDDALYAAYDAIPSRGPLAANTVAGTISGWRTALDAASGWGRALPLGRLLEDAIHYAENGFPLTGNQHGLTTSKLAVVSQH